MKKMIAIKNIRVEETLYKPGEEFEISEEETQRLIDLGAAEFVGSEIQTADNEETNSEEENNVGGLKEAKTSKKGTKNE